MIDGVILAFDLAWDGLTGWVAWNGDDVDPIVAYGQFKPKSRGKGAARAAYIGRQIMNEIGRLIDRFSPFLVVYEVTDWHQKLQGRGDWKKKYKQERQTQACLGRGEMALLLSSSQAKFMSIGATEAKEEYTSNPTASKATVAQLLANAYPRRLDFRLGEDDNWTVTDLKTGQAVSDHITDAMALADVIWHRLRYEGVIIV